jgi:hypothetical protein
MFCLSAIYTGVFYKRIPSKLINKEKDVSNVQSNGLFHKTMESIKLMIWTQIVTFKFNRDHGELREAA